MFKKLKERKRKKLRQLDLSEETWRQIGEIYSHILVDEKISFTNEEIVKLAIMSMHQVVVIERGLKR